MVSRVPREERVVPEVPSEERVRLSLRWRGEDLEIEKQRSRRNLPTSW